MQLILQQFNIHEVLLEQKLLRVFNRAHRLFNQPKNFLILVLSELIVSQSEQQSSCFWELFSELIDSLTD